MIQEERFVREPLPKGSVQPPTSPARKDDLPMPGVLESQTPCPNLRDAGTSTLNPTETGYINDSIVSASAHRV